MSDLLGAMKEKMDSAYAAARATKAEAMVMLKDRSIPLAERWAFLCSDDTEAFALSELDWLFDDDEAAIIESGAFDAPN